MMGFLTRLAAALLLLVLPVPAQHEQPPPSTTRDKPNRMAKEQSPYLLQHAHDPVDWYPWGTEAFDKAKKEDKPVFLSIGYAACHWCHVMQRESFQNKEIAAYMNEHFVSIKLDREERPDIDRIYMGACQTMGGRGGWPLSAFITVDRKPITVGTYYPPPNFLNWLKLIQEHWSDKEKRTALLSRTDDLARYLVEQQTRTPSEELPGIDIMDDASEAVLATEDKEFGGFSVRPPHFAPKFPSPSTPLFLLRSAARKGDPTKALGVQRMLDALLRGGIRDHLAGGFHRYSTDREWKLPHFEKMLYDQALLTVLFLEGHAIWSAPRYADAVRTTLEWCMGELQSPEGGFIAALDADADHVEGATYVWKLQELTEILTPDEARCVIAWCGATSEGNWVEEGHPQQPTNTNILYERHSPNAVAKTLAVDVEKVTNLLASARLKLLRARPGHPQPARDTKVLTGWNGLMISALARAGAAFQEPRYLEAAQRTMAMLDAHLRQKNGRYHRSFASGIARHQGELFDHAALLCAVLDLHEATLDRAWIGRARELAKVIETEFKGPGGGFVDSKEEDLIFQTQYLFDGARPSGTSLAILGLTRLAILTSDEKIRAQAHTATRAVHDALVRSPAAAGHALIALDLMQRPAVKVELHGNEVALLTPLRTTGYHPFVSITKADVEIPEKAFVLVCVGKTCLKPAYSGADVLERVKEALASDR